MCGPSLTETPSYACHTDFTVTYRHNQLSIVLSNIQNASSSYWCFVTEINSGLRRYWAWGSAVVKELPFKSEGPGIDSGIAGGFSPWHLTVPCALGLTQPLKMSTRLILEVKAAGA
jgi:hypothetical protein